MRDRNRGPRARVAVASTLVLAALLLPARGAAAGDASKPPATVQAFPPAKSVGDAEARAALKAFDTAMQVREMDRRMTALRDLAGFAHPIVAERLLKAAVGNESVEFRTAAFRALAQQPDEAGRIAKTVTAWIAAMHGESRKALAKGDFGLVVDRKSGDVDLASDAGKAAMEAKRARARLIAAAVDLVSASETKAEPFREAVLFWLQDGDDDLVALCLRIVGTWKDAETLPDLLALYRMYPTPARWETGAVADLGGTNASARAKWMTVYGDPDKRRPRPKVVSALRTALESVTGRAFDTPGELEAYLKDPPKRQARR